jgi:hypothetical protein
MFPQVYVPNFHTLVVSRIFIAGDLGGVFRPPTCPVGLGARIPHPVDKVFVFLSILDEVPQLVGRGSKPSPADRDII